RARPSRRRGTARPPERRAAAGPRRDRLRIRLHRRRGRTMVAPARAASTPGSARRLNAPVVVRVEAHVDGSPKRVNRSPVAVVREEWRGVHRWGTEEPVSRWYHDGALAASEHDVE